jgi:hypothetical protein
MVSCFDGSSKSGDAADTAPTKKIVTPAGQRLSVVLNNAVVANDASNRTRDSNRTSMRKSGIVNVGEVPRESSESASEGTSGTSGYTFHVWSGPKEKDYPEFGSTASSSQKKRKKRLLIIAACALITLIIALGAGLGAGLSKSKKSAGTSGEDASQSSVATQTAGGSHSPQNPKPTAPSSELASLYPNFPKGRWKSALFLDTVQENCTAVERSWTCAPGKTYNEDHMGSQIHFAWEIDGDQNKGYIITFYPLSTTNLGLELKSLIAQHVQLNLANEGEAEERYWFRMQIPKFSIVMNDAFSEEAVALSNMTCTYQDTTYQGTFYTRMDKSEYLQQETPVELASGLAKYAEWPKALKIEQSASGGENVPECHFSQGRFGPPQTKDRAMMCSCLYKNFRPPKGSY